MTDRALLLSTHGPFLAATLATLVVAGCSGGSSGAGSGSPAASPGAGGDSSASSDDATGGDVPPGVGSDGAAPGSGDDSSAPGSALESGAPGSTDSSDAGALPGWKLTWSDEFNGPDGSAVDPKKWKHDVGGTGWGNNELEYYTDGTQNAVQKGGNLVVTATTDGASQY